MSAETMQTVMVFAVLLTIGYIGGCCTLAISIAAEKHRPEWEPWVYALMFGPLGVLIVACLPERDPKPAPALKPIGPKLPAAAPPPAQRIGKPLGREIHQ